MSDEQWLKPEVLEIERLAATLSGSELQSLLLRELRRRATERSTADVVAQYQASPFCQPAVVDQRTSTDVDAHLLAAAEGFEAIELSPVTPLGTCSTVALTDQNRVLSALRQTEVVADPTNVLALECATRLRARPNEPVHLATCQRVIRAQPVPKLPGYAQHFRIFTLASAGRETQDHAAKAATRPARLRAARCRAFSRNAAACLLLGRPALSDLGDSTGPRRRARGGDTPDRRRCV